MAAWPGRGGREWRRLFRLPRHRWPLRRRHRPCARAGRARLGILRYTADLDSGGWRRGLQIALGLVWLLDAALQYQPYMFSRGFVT